MIWLRSQFRTFESLVTWWRNNLTLGGKTITGTLLLCGPRLATLDSAMFLLFWAQLSLLVVAGGISFWLRPRLVVRMLAPDTVRRGELVDLIAQVSNRSSRSSCDLRMELVDAPRSWEMQATQQAVALLGAGESMTMRMTVRPTRRGQFELPSLRVTSTFPLNLFRLGCTHCVRGELVVLPTYRPLSALHVPRVAFHWTGEQLHSLVALGHGGEYFGSREYQPGMPVRRWDYRSWARLGQPVVREYSDLQHPTAAIFLDTSVAHNDEPQGGTTEPELEAMLSLAAALSESLTSLKFRIVLLATGQGLHDVSMDGLSVQHEAVVRALAVVAPTQDTRWSDLRSDLQDDPRIPDVAFVLLRHQDETRDGVCRDLRMRGCEVTRIIIHEQASSNTPRHVDDVYVSTTDIEAGRVTI